MEALVLGAGGAARAVVYALLEAGAARVDVWNRHPERAETLVARPRRRPAKTALRSDRGATRPRRGPARERHLGRHAQPMQAPDAPEATEVFKELPLSADELDDRLIVVDLVYRQDRTPLVRAALRTRGCVCVDGFDVLVHQGAASFRLWTGMQAPLGAMRRGATGRRRLTHRHRSEAGPERTGPARTTPPSSRPSTARATPDVRSGARRYGPGVVPIRADAPPDADRFDGLSLPDRATRAHPAQPPRRLRAASSPITSSSSASHREDAGRRRDRRGPLQRHDPGAGAARRTGRSRPTSSPARPPSASASTTST